MAERSPGMALLDHVASYERSGRSKQRVRSVYQQAVDLAIGANMRFDIGDFQPRWWWGATSLEGWYRLACDTPNLSAAKALEHYLGRKPFLFPAGGRKRQRLAVGAGFWWEGKYVSVTSFDDAHDCLMACAYTYDEQALARKLTRRYRISHEDLLKERRKREAAA